MTTLLVTCAGLPEGEPGHEVLEAAMAARGVGASWVSWDDPGVDWAAADLVAVRSTWDYVPRYAEFLAWARSVPAGILLNGADAFEWNHDKRYLVDLPGLGVPTVATRLAATTAELAAAVRELGTAVVKPRVSAGGAGLLVVDDPADPRLGTEVTSHPSYPPVSGPWIVQPLVESIRTSGETSVFVIGGRAVSQVDKLPAAGEVRVHEEFGGSSIAVPLSKEPAAVAVAAVGAAAAHLGRGLDYARVDLVRVGAELVVGELELIEPGLYLGVSAAPAAPFADLLAARLAARS